MDRTQTSLINAKGSKNIIIFDVNTIATHFSKHDSSQIPHRNQSNRHKAAYVASVPFRGNNAVINASKLMIQTLALAGRPHGGRSYKSNIFYQVVHMALWSMYFLWKNGQKSLRYINYSSTL